MQRFKELQQETQDFKILTNNEKSCHCRETSSGLIVDFNIYRVFSIEKLRCANLSEIAEVGFRLLGPLKDIESILE